MFMGEWSAQSFLVNSGLRGRDFPTARLCWRWRPGAPPGLSHAGKNAMLPTRTSFEDVGLPPPSSAATIESGSRNGRSTADSSLPVPLAPKLEIMRLWTQKMGMGMRMGVGRGGRFRLLLLLLLLLLCSCRVSLVWTKA